MRGCSPVKRWLLAMLADGCGAARARLTASARSSLQGAGRGAGTGATSQTRELTLIGQNGRQRRSTQRAKTEVTEVERHIYTLSHRRSQAVPAPFLQIPKAPVKGGSKPYKYLLYLKNVSADLSSFSPEGTTRSGVVL